jgi:hypothetical protein
MLSIADSTAMEEPVILPGVISPNTPTWFTVWNGSLYFVAEESPGKLAVFRMDAPPSESSSEGTSPSAASSTTAPSSTSSTSSTSGCACAVIHDDAARGDTLATGLFAMACVVILCRRAARRTSVRVLSI